MHYTLIDYFDVWGSDEGWQVNNLCIIEDDIYIDDTCTDVEIIEYLINIGYLKEEAKEQVYIDHSGDPFMIDILQISDDLPLYSLRQKIF